MQTDNRFSPDVVALLDQTDEVRIEPPSADGQPMQPVIIWVVVLDVLPTTLRLEPDTT